MASRQTRTKTQKTICGTVYSESSALPPGVLPTKKNVVECLMYLMRKDRAGKQQRTVTDGINLMAYTLIAHWEFCNIYTIHRKNLVQRLQRLYSDFKNNVQQRVSRQTDAWKASMKQYNEDMMKLFDIFCEDTACRERLEEECGVKMTEMEWAFLDDMRNGRKMMCEDFVDRQWQRARERIKAREERVARMTAAKLRDEETYRSVSWEEVNMSADEDDPSTLEIDSDDDYNNAEDADQTTHSSRRTSHSSISEPGPSGDNMSHQYAHIRQGIRKVRPEFYRVVDKLKSKFHCSSNQAVAAVIEVANGMFGRQWKYHSEDETCVDLDTAPHVRNIRESGKAICALTLSCIVDEIMRSDDVVITYHSDGSKRQGAGGYSVQGITIDGKYRAFPTLPISSESRANLAKLKLTVLNILAVCGEVDASDIFAKITFQETDATSHNFEVDEQVALELGTEHVPIHLLCHTHPVLMFNRKLVEFFGKVEKEIGPDKIYSNFLVNATTSHDSVTEQFIDCSTRLVAHDFDHKPWNKATQFELHISPRKNYTVSLRKERFNRFVYLCAVTLHHEADIKGFLEKYDMITNTLACIVRAFQDVEFINVFLVCAAVIGVHLIEPYLSLTYFDQVDYEQLIPTMQQLYHDLTHTSPEQLIDITKPAFKFVDQKRFDSLKWNKEILTSLSAHITANKENVLKILNLLLPVLADGFFVQRGNVFGFGDFDPTSEKLVTNHDIAILKQAPINNLDAERSVGSINYELDRRGPKQLSAAGSAHVKAKSVDLVELHPVDEFKQFGKKAKRVNSLVTEWSAEQAKLEESGLSRMEVSRVSAEKRKLSDLEKLVAQGGPFTRSKQVDDFLKRKRLSDKDKQDRLYLEVRYARDTTLSLPKSSDLFRLRESYQALPTKKLAKNLKVYLDKASSNASVTWADFDAAVSAIAETTMEL